jgi:predicted MFS family arabinose efflux permease
MIFMDQTSPTSFAKKHTTTALYVLALCFLFSMLGRGLNETFTVFLLPITQGFGWDRAEVISIYSFAALTTGLAAPFVGRLFDHSGPRTVYSLGFCAGLGAACLGNVPNSIMLGRWFGPKLSTAMAVVYSAMGAGVLILLPLSQLLINKLGWRDVYEAFGGATLFLLLPLLLLPWKLLSAGSPTLTKTVAEDLIDEGWTLLSAMRHHAFWALFSTFFFTAIGMYAISAQVVAYLVDAGFAPLQAATAWGFSGVVLLFGMLSVTWLDGVIGRRRSVLLSYAISIIGIGMLWLLQRHPNIWLLTGFVVCFGSMLGSRGPLISATAMKIFRGKRVGTIFGTISIGSGLGSALGSWSGGLIHDLTGSYDALLGYALVSVILGMIPFLVIPALRE